MGTERKIIPVILAGGTGTRLWPLSRNSLPKQFLALTGDHTLYQDTLSRVAPDDLFAPPLVVTNAQFRFFARRQASEIGITATVILEPVQRDSAAALIAACALARDMHGPDALILALAADHVITEPDIFRAAILTAATHAARGHIVTFGITPREPSTRYGYIRPGAPLPDGAHQVEAFVEKPDRATAETYIAAGYLWNCGNFLFPAELMLSQADLFEPLLTRSAIAAVEKAGHDLGFIRLDYDAFAAAPAKSIDFAVMEKTRHAAVVAAHFGWSDVGSWDALRDISAKDSAGNVTRGPVELIDSHDSYVHSDGPLVAGIGLDHLCVVASEDAILIMPADRSQDVKTLVAGLKAARHVAADAHPKIHRPWGSYQTITRGDRFHVKTILVEPGAQLSLQRHHHRSEHWVVVSGTAQVTLEGKTFTIHENESTYIPIGSVHRLANPGRIPLQVIEVQTGSYLGEDDIVRLEDAYDRT